MTRNSNRLSKEEHDRVFRQEVLPESGIDNFNSQERPKAIVLAGQPGAGKGALKDAVVAEFNNDIFPVDPDEQREFHPQAKGWQRESPYGWSQQTNDDAGAFARELRDAGIERRVNLLIDTTLGGADGAIKTIQDLQKAGYEVEIRAVAAHDLESRVGIDRRFTSKVDAEGVGRDVPLPFHDKVYGDLPDNLDKVAANTGVRVRIYDRDDAALAVFDSQRDPGPPSAALREMRDARLQSPITTERMRSLAQEQADWHRDPQERLVESGKMSPETLDALRRERLDAGKPTISARDSEAWSTLDELVRDGAPPARAPIPDFELPPLNRAATTAGLAAFGAAAAAYDAKDTAERLSTAYAQDNPSAVQSEATHFVARGVGGIAAGFTPAALGVSGGPAVALAVTDGYLLTEAYDHGAKYLDRNRIVFQTGSDGGYYAFNGKQWLRDDLKADFRDDGVQRLQQQDFAAPPEIERELNAKASAEAVSQAIGKADPRNPFVQPSIESDPAHLHVRDWTRDAETGRWSRTVADAVDRNDAPVWKADPELASPARAAELDRQALAVIDRNIVEGPAVLAAQYQLGAKRSGFGDFRAEPESVTTALNPNTLEASNGKQYVRDAQGQWSHDGTPATGNRALELEATRERLGPVLAQHQQQLAETKPYEPPTPEQRDRAQLRQAYTNEGWNPSPEQFEASYLAVKRTRQMSDLTPENSALVLEKDANGQTSLNSPILHTRQGPNHEVQVAAKTYPDEIDVALSDVRARGMPKGAIEQAAPLHAIEQATTEQRDVREQAQREANRAGLSQDATNDVVRSAAPSLSAPSGRNGKGDDNEREPLEGSSPKRATNGVGGDPTVSAPVPPDFAPSRHAARDIRDPLHEGNDALREMQYRAKLFETQNNIPHGPHSDRLGASMLAFAVDNKIPYQELSLEKNQDTGQVQLKHAKYGEPTRYFPADLKQLSSQPIDVASQRINEAVSKHNANPAPALERTQEQAQALGAYSFEDKVMFARVRGGTPGHISDETVGASVLEAKKHGLDATNISQVSMVGEHIRIARSGPDDKAVLFDVNAPVPPLQASIEATNTVNQAQALAKQQTLTQEQNPQPDGPKGPTIGGR